MRLLFLAWALLILIMAIGLGFLLWINNWSW